MPRTSTFLSLIGIWLLSFVFCFSISLYWRVSIPESFTPLMKQVFETFTPPLAVMLAFAFAVHRRENPLRERGGSFVSQDLLAIVLSCVYVLIFDGVMWMFAVGSMTANDAMELFQSYRSSLAFLITGFIAFYFGSQKLPKA